ncbi:MAG: pantoate--beta-alanine ligase [Alphaproteobacteria bacterium]|nr:MAG: pantoate--beta-alanine ligase [Alphaproteobacteria bacterium]
MKTVHTLEDVRWITDDWRRAGETVAVVPTMGALHAGHMSLVEAARSWADRVIVWIFVNPKQFDNPDDLEKYPRHMDRDATMLARAGVDLLYAPRLEEVYPAGFSTRVSVAGVSEGLCGAGRPGHFDGVATVVTKIFTQTRPDRAYFGQKDFQQLQVVSRLVRDLDLGVEIIGCPTVREADGLALSSRNERLTEDERRKAPALYRALCRAAEALREGAHVAETLAEARLEIVSAGFASVEYLELRAENGLAPLDRLSEPARLLAAAHIGAVRLIDNVPVTP